MKKTALLLVSLLAMASIASSDTHENGDPMAARIERQQQADDRHEFDLRRDAARKPYELFRFLGLDEGMVALDVGAYAGYTTEMLSAAVGPTGKVYSHNTEKVLKTYARGYYDRTMTERLANDRLPNVVLHLREYDDLGLDNEVDVAFLGNLLHDFYYRDGEQSAVAFLQSIHAALKPGGVLGVMDHVGREDADNARLHRMAPTLARDLLEQAGFAIDAESELFANPDDDYSLMVYNDAVYLRTDRFLFRARKPR
jgi:predicted methyltransferase